MDQSKALVPAGSPGVPSLNFGARDFDATDFIPPRVKILQPLSQETTGDAKAGDWFNTLTQQNYGPVLRVVPITPLKQRVFLSREGAKRDQANDMLIAAGLPELPEGDGLMCRTLDMVRGVGYPGDVLWADGERGCETCPLQVWQDRKTPPPCTETYNVAGLSDEGDLLITSMSKSGARTGKSWFSMLRLSDAMPWTRVYELTTVEESSKIGRWWSPRVRMVGPAPTDLMAKAERWYPQLTGIRIDVTPVAEDDSEASDDAELAAAKF